MSKRIGIVILVLSVLLVVNGLINVGAQEPKKESSPTASELQQKIQELITQLGAEDFQMREAAQQELIKIGEPALAPLEKALKESKDPEIKLRAQNIIHTITVTLNIEKLPQAWGEKWYSIRAKMGAAEPQKLGYYTSSLREGEYEDQKVFIIKDHMVLTEPVGPGSSQVMDIKSEIYCIKNQYLSPLYVKLVTSIKPQNQKQEMEFKVKDGKVTDFKGPAVSHIKDGTKIPSDFVWSSAFYPLITTRPFKKGTSFDFKGSRGMLEASEDRPEPFTPYQIIFEGKENLKIGGKTISVYKFKTPGYTIDTPRRKAFGSSFDYWISRERKLVKVSIEKGGIELLLTTKEEALKGFEEKKK